MNEAPKLTRWTVEGSEAPPELRRMLESGRGQLGSAEDVAELSRNLARALGPAAGLPAAQLAAPKAPLGLGHWAGWLAGGAGGALVLWNLLGPQPVNQAMDVKPAASVSAAPAPSLSPEPLEPLEPAPTAPQIPDAIRPPMSDPAPLASEPELEAHDAVVARERGAKAARPSEAELLRQAQAALAQHPAQALALTRQHSSRFPRGALTQEREVIAIEALERLGRKRAAADRALAFEKSYRGSVHQSRLRGGTPAAVPTPPDSTRVPH